jgi:heterodisulfide reductase subunit A
MYAIKEAIIAREHSKEGLLTDVFFMDMRTYGKDFERTYEGAKEKGVRFIRSRIHSVEELDNQNLRLEYADENGNLKTAEYDMVVLSQGLVMDPVTASLCAKLELELSPGGFVKTGDFSPVAASRPGIYVCGALAGPKDIPLSVMEASAAACAAGGDLSASRKSLIKEPEIKTEKKVVGDPPRIGVFVCSCGINIAGVVDVKAVMDFAATLPHVAYVENNLFTCSQDTQDKMAQVIREQGLNRIVVAACSPRTHEPLFQETLKAAGLNKYLFEMANIRNQGSWVHSHEPQKATQRAKDQVRMAVAKAALLEPLTESRLSILPKAMVIGGGISGMTAALEFSRQGFLTHLVERDNVLGGNARFLTSTQNGEDIQVRLTELINQIKNDPNISLHLGTTIEKVEGFVGNFNSTLRTDQNSESVEHGVCVIATGAKEHQPTGYLHGKDPRVKTHLELDAALLNQEIDPKKCKSIVFIQCVGSREPERPYCSKVCCTHSVKKAIQFKENNPKCKVTVLYRDMRT